MELRNDFCLGFSGNIDLVAYIDLPFRTDFEPKLLDRW